MPPSEDLYRHPRVDVESSRKGQEDVSTDVQRPLRSTSLVRPVRQVIIDLDQQPDASNLGQTPGEQSGPRCASCKSDRQKCVWTANEAKCARCLNNGYPCHEGDEEAEAGNKRRKLSRFKCDNCRQGKQKCLPVDRKWPAKCERCISKALPCSEPRTSADTRSPPGMSPRPQSPDPGSTKFNILRGFDEPLHALPRSLIFDTGGSALRPEVRNEFRYPKLGPGEDFRLLVVHPGRPSDPIKCNLVGTGFTSASPYKYEALSYWWSDGTVPSERISITSVHQAPEVRFSLSNVNSATFFVRPTLMAALRALRSPTDDVVLWIDAICLDHSNMEEEKSRVTIMPAIFHHASSVCVWLGLEPVTKDAAGVFGLIRAMLDLANLEQLLVTPQNAGHWEAFIRLLSNAWFTHRWVIQDIAFARQATVRYGNEKVDWEDFADAVSLFETIKDRVRDLLFNSKGFPTTMVRSDPSLTWPVRGVFTLIDTIRRLFRKTDDGFVANKLFSLEILVSIFVNSVTPDPRDTIYSLLSISKDTPLRLENPSIRYIHRRIRPDSSKPISEVYMEFVDYCIETTECLDIICRHWVVHSQESMKAKGIRTPGIDPLVLPSWILDVTTSAFGDPKQMMGGRLNGDDIVGVPNIRGSRHYNASLNIVPKYTLGRVSLYRDHDAQDANMDDDDEYTADPAVDNHTVRMPRAKSSKIRYDGTLTVYGCVVALINETSPRVAGGVIPQEGLELGGWPMKDTPNRVPEELWRTLVADRGPNGANAPSWYARACLECLQHVTRNGDLETNTLISSQSTPPLVVEFLERVQAVAWNRRFIRTARTQELNPLLGLAPTKTKPGDAVAILFGCSVPVILRRRPGDDGDFEFIGGAYIHGIMDGEALPEEAYRSKKERKFRLR